MRNLFVLPDGTEIFSGVGRDPAIQEVTYTRYACSETNLDYASACANMVEASLIDKSGAFSLTAGTEVEYYRVDDAGERSQVGRFFLETPARPRANSYKFTAYDRMILFDKDLTDWLTGLSEWPYTMQTLLGMICDECGVELEQDLELINGDFQVIRFVYQGVTGRKLIRWIAGANAARAFITPEGKLSFQEFTTGEVALPIRSIDLADYVTAPIERVVIRQAEDDIGVAWPEDSTGETYTITGNPLLGVYNSEDLLPVAQNIAGRVLGLSYTPGKVQLFDPDCEVLPGVFYTVTDRNGMESTVIGFSVTYSGGVSTLESTGYRARESAAAVNNQDTLQIVQGRVAEMKVSLEEVSSSLQQTSITVESVRQEQAEVIQRVDSISSRVSTTEETVETLKTKSTVLEQDADSLSLSIKSIREELGEKADRATVEEITEHFLFNEDGLTISNTGTGMGIGVSEKRVIFTGGEDPTTEIYPDRMKTTNLYVGERLDLGDFSFIPRTNGNLSFRYTGGN